MLAVASNPSFLPSYPRHPRLAMTSFSDHHTPLWKLEFDTDVAEKEKKKSAHNNSVLCPLGEWTPRLLASKLLQTRIRTHTTGRVFAQGEGDWRRFDGFGSVTFVLDQTGPGGGGSARNLLPWSCKKKKKRKRWEKRVGKNIEKRRHRMSAT